MTFVPVRRNPSTTIGAGPASHTVAPKSRKSLPGSLYSSMDTPHAGSATRSGSVLGRGFVRVGRALLDAVVAVAPVAGAQNGGHPDGFVDTTSSIVADASAGAIANRR